MDILLEVDRLGWLEQYVDAQNYARTCLYLASCCSYLPEADDRAVLHAAFSIYMKARSDTVIWCLLTGHPCHSKMSWVCQIHRLVLKLRSVSSTVMALAGTGTLGGRGREQD